MAQKRDLYQEVTNKVVAAIEAGAKGDDWSLPWHSINRGMPFNATSRHEYRGVNVLMLWATAIEAHYPTAQWASYKQWRATGAQVRKGEHGTMIVYAGQIVKEDENKQEGEISSADRVSWAALGWLETSIRSYAKYVDVAARASGGDDDEGAVMRRERMAIEEIAELIDEMKQD